VFTEIDRLEKTEIKTTQKIKYDDVFDKPLKLGTVLLLIEQVLAQGWWRFIP
jgi:hypothetical protein